MSSISRWRARGTRAPALGGGRALVIDLDSFIGEVYGEQ